MPVLDIKSGFKKDYILRWFFYDSTYLVCFEPQSASCISKLESQLNLLDKIE